MVETKLLPLSEFTLCGLESNVSTVQLRLCPDYVFISKYITLAVFSCCVLTALAFSEWVRYLYLGFNINPPKCGRFDFSAGAP